ncbi:MAG: AgmX/PglI C-terminal domain-containing protein [Myxococcales bacterium]|nr:AgmX/PglI C-terminal domain-containing protein [Myxococcota bacterium]MDW8280706.1 AgmX/PglI C-terminal domain-containing protein [Myxococcales bacterium]
MQLSENQPGRRLRVVFLYRGEPLEERDFSIARPSLLSRRPARITLGQGGEDTFSIPPSLLPPSFPLLRVVGDEVVLRLAQSMVGRLQLAGVSMSVEEFFRERRGVAVPGGPQPLREQVLGPQDWGVVAFDPAGSLAVFFQPLPPRTPETDLRPTGPWGLPVLRDRFVRQAMALSAAVHAVILLLAWLVWEPPPMPVLDAPAAARLARLVWDVPAVHRSQLSRPAEVPMRPSAGMGAQLAPGRERHPHPRRPLLSDDDPRPPVVAPATAAVAPLAAGPQMAAGTPAPSAPTAPPRPDVPRSQMVPRSMLTAQAGAAPLMLAGPPTGGAAERPLRVVVISGRPAVQGALSSRDIDQVVTYHQGDVESCYRAELARTPELGGRLVLHFGIDASGRVTQARVESSTLASPSLEACIVQRALRWRFPSAPTPTPAASMPFVLRTSS